MNVENNVDGQWKKNCPKCGKKQVYSSWNSLRGAMRKNTICSSCHAIARKIVPPNGVWGRICKMCGNDMVYSCRRSFNSGKRNNSVCRVCAVSNSHKRNPEVFSKTDECKLRISKILTSLRNTKIYGEGFKQKCRENKLRQIRQQGVQRTFNVVACKFMDGFNQKFGVRLQHALNGGEVQIMGYSLDGYDKDKNIIFEYDEPKHRISSIKKKDKERQERLIKHLCPSKFIRYDEKEKTMIDVISGGRII